MKIAVFFCLVISAVADVVEDSTQCAYVTMNQTIPVGRTNVTHLSILGEVGSNEECVQQCCTEDALYQYAWVVDNKCYGVSCSDNDEELCAPQSVNFSMVSMYMKIDRNSESRSPPHIVISPSNNITVLLPDDVAILDASETTSGSDNETSLTFEWTLLEGPALDHNITESFSDSSLQLENLIAGTYRIKLSVTDAEGLISIAYANVTVEPVQDYPPTANAGEPIVIHLPNTEVTLSGADSTDDKHIVSYSWKQESGEAVEMSGIDGDTLHVTNLKVGVYKFSLTVKDALDQESTATVTVYVKEKPTVVEPDKNVKLTDKDITVEVDGNKIISLPKNEVKIYASTWPEPSDSTPFFYQWEKVSGPTEGSLSGLHESTISLSGLVEGIYTLTLLVHDNHGHYGTTEVNVTVLPVPHTNMPPHIVISPSNSITIKLPVDVAILDASETKDEEKEKLKYKWDLLGGTMLDLNKISDSFSDPLLHLHDLIAGTYNLELRVTDAEGLTSIAHANVTVEPVQDYPPTANAGEPIVIHLPNTEVTLSGADSTDDKRIVSYSWKQESGEAVEMNGIDGDTLHVTNLKVGVYQFSLTVKDALDQKSTATVTVAVQEEDNQPPLAVTDGNITVYYPNHEAILNGSKSSDDYVLTHYNWTVVDKPPQVTLSLEGADKPVLRVSNLRLSGLSPTWYRFRLTVTDYGNLTSSTDVFIKYVKDKEILPISEAGSDVTISLPETSAVLDGSNSYDGFGIVSYIWTRSDTSPAAGAVVGESDKKPVLMLSDLVEGTYHFTLTVINSNDVNSSDTVTLTVKEDANKLYIVQLYVVADITNFTQTDLIQLTEHLIIRSNSIHYNIHVQAVLPHNEHILIEFYVTDETDHDAKVNASKVVRILTRGKYSFKLGKYHIGKVEEKVCQNACSGHGYCNTRTKRCVCSTFWMENPIKANFGGHHSNCEWSILYVVLVGVGGVFSCILCSWCFCCCCIRRRKNAKQKLRKYALLDHKEDGLHMLQRNGYHKQSVVMSETETEEEVLFESSRKQGKNEQKALISSVNDGKNT